MIRPSLDSIYMRLAWMLADRSTCSRLQVGAVVASADLREVYAVGYNGGAVGQENDCDRPAGGRAPLPGGCGHVHAEANALSFAPARVPKVAFVTHAPCPVCARLMVNKLGFERVTYVVDYRDSCGIDILTKAGIQVNQDTYSRAGTGLVVVRAPAPAAALIIEEAAKRLVGKFVEG